METPYRPAICDLCDSPEYSVVIELSTGRAMRSDRRITHSNLRKYVCKRCGLVRSGHSFEHQGLAGFYSNEYRLSEQSEEYFFQTPEGPISRSSLFCDWIVSETGGSPWQKNSRCLEVGAGSGILLQEFIRRFPDITFEGAELNRSAVELAHRRGLAIHPEEPGKLEPEQYDTIYSIAVIEHVASPARFIKDLRRLLKPGGHLVLCQPTQDVPSYDVFFTDHLHHFGSEHLRQYALKGGFHEQRAFIGHRWMPNFSLHLWQADESKSEFKWQGQPAQTTCAATGYRIVGDMERLNLLLASLAERKRRVAVFGLNEVYWLARAYSKLGDFPIVCGFDDNPDKAEYATLGFPVLAPENYLEHGVEEVILTMNKIYYAHAQERLEQMGLTVHRLLS
jgi:2-polyprenyl-3-methyl-5-hydroxy-6-metoxy-1,4-benzoquinol methylase